MGIKQLKKKKKSCLQGAYNLVGTRVPEILKLRKYLFLKNLYI